MDASRDIGNITEGDVLKLTCIYMCKEMARRDIVSRLYLQEMADVLYDMGMCYWKLSRLDAAEKVFSQALGIHDDKCPGHFRTPTLLWNLGEIAYTQQRYVDAIPMYMRFVTIALH